MLTLSIRKESMVIKLNKRTTIFHKDGNWLHGIILIRTLIPDWYSLLHLYLLGPVEFVTRKVRPVKPLPYVDLQLLYL